MCSNFIPTSILNSLNLSKYSPLDFNAYNHAFIEKSTMKVMKYLALPIYVILMGPHMWQCIIFKYWSLASTIGRKHNSMLFAFNARFAMQRECDVRKFANVHITQHILECMNNLHKKMAKAVVPKLERTISRWKLHQVGHIRSMHLRKIHFIQIFFP